MRNRLIAAFIMVSNVSALAQAEPRLRTDIPPCFKEKIPLIDDGKADVPSVINALLFECHVELARYYATISRLPIDDPKLPRIMDGNRIFDVGRAASAILAARVKAHQP